MIVTNNNNSNNNNNNVKMVSIPVQKLGTIIFNNFCFFGFF